MNYNKRKKLRFPPHQSDSGKAFINGVVAAKVIDESFSGCCLEINNVENIHLQKNGKYILSVNKINLKANLRWIKLEKDTLRAGFKYL